MSAVDLTIDERDAAWAMVRAGDATHPRIVECRHHAAFGYSQQSNVRRLTHTVTRVAAFFPADRPPLMLATWTCGGGSINAALTWEPKRRQRMCGRCLHRDRPPFVYFATRNGLIKIGCSKHPERRMSELDAHLIATVPGGYELERSLHRRFDHIRAFGAGVDGREWFHPADELVEHIAALIDNGQAILAPTVGATR